MVKGRNSTASCPALSEIYRKGERTPTGQGRRTKLAKIFAEAPTELLPYVN